METPEARTGLSLLLVDDDAELCSMMKDFFSQMGHGLDCAYNGGEGLARALENSYDLIVLDVMLPAVGGLTLLQQLRKRKSTPVILLTAKVQRSDRILGLNAGADDYVTKPFDPDELLARVYAVLRRVPRAVDPTLTPERFGELAVNFNTREVWLNGAIVDLTAMEFDILQLLLRSAGRIVSREEITMALMERKLLPWDRALDVHISHLRKKLEGRHELIRTVRGAGYMFTAEPGTNR